MQWLTLLTHEHQYQQQSEPTLSSSQSPPNISILLAVNREATASVVPMGTSLLWLLLWSRPY